MVWKTLFSSKEMPSKEKAGPLTSGWQYEWLSAPEGLAPLQAGTTVLPYSQTCDKAQSLETLRRSYKPGII